MVVCCFPDILDQKFLFWRDCCVNHVAHPLILDGFEDGVHVIGGKDRMIVCGNDKSASEAAPGGFQQGGNAGCVRVGGCIFDVGAVK